jgi:hypothetical protein
MVYLGWIRDFWFQFNWYLRMEEDLPTTYFIIPFKNRPGDKLSGSHSERRATAYDIADIPEWASLLIREGCEIGVHGIDAWHSVEKGRAEMKRIALVTGESEIGIRMHWLLSDGNTPQILEKAGYCYDSSSGYNEDVGYRCGTTQAFRPLGARRLLELPIHIQDGALFFSRRLGLSEPEAWQRCETLLHRSSEFGGILTIIWHDRSPGPERFWGDFYAMLLRELKSHNVWFGTARQMIHWFQKRRDAVFETSEAASGAIRLKLRYNARNTEPPLSLRIHGWSRDKDEVCARGIDNRTVVDITLSFGAEIELNQFLETMPEVNLEHF